MIAFLHPMLPNTIRPTVTTGLAVLLAAVVSGCSDEFESAEPTPEPPCHPTELEDDFEGDQISLLWDTIADTGTIGVAEGHGFAELSPNLPDQYLVMLTARQYDLTGCNVWVEVPKVPASDVPAAVSLSVGLSPGNGGLFQVTAGELAVGLVVNQNYEAGTQKSYDLAAHRWWRIRHEDGDLHFETSPDGQQWELLLRSASPAEPSAVTIGFVLQNWDPYDQPVRFEIDNLNLLP
ncbi:MAG: hypothetical protein JRI68_00280 [Deltaproteobacteria bacterium]|nr:hypothetical protein [Deltaproteobacteria bacterium]